MDTLDILIREEQAKLAFVRQKVAELEKRVSVLLAMRQDDAVDAALRKEAVPASGAIVSSGVYGGSRSAPDQRPVRGELSSLIIEAMPLDGTITLDRLIAAMQSSSTRDIEPGSVRTLLMNLRKRHGLVENPRPGLYALSPRGRTVRASAQPKEEGPSAPTESPSVFSTNPGGKPDDSSESIF